MSLKSKSNTPNGDGRARTAHGAPPASMEMRRILTNGGETDIDRALRETIYRVFRDMSLEKPSKSGRRPKA